MYYLSPLRYPGGKGELAPFLARLARAQAPRVTEYAEPFAGGAGAALRLLADEEVQVVHLNDLNPGIAAMWEGAVYEAQRFAERIRRQPADIDSWHRARQIYITPDEYDRFELGFATFLLNRWNRSGIIAARPIGGLKQTGNWKIDARFNRENLAQRVEQLGEYQTRINVTQLDAREFIKLLEAEHPRALTYVDPPYLTQGEDLYFDSLAARDHDALAAQLRESDLRWLLTYDADERVTEELYLGLRCAEFRIAHTAHTQHIGVEYVVFGSKTLIPDLDIINRGDARWVAG
jgi:DNA adenine methylase